MSGTVVSVVVPCLNDEDSVRPLYERLRPTLGGAGGDYELVFRLDPCTDATEDRIEEAQFTEFEVGILVANDVTAEFIADLHHLMDFHGQDFDAILQAGQAKYEAHQEAVSG